MRYERKVAQERILNQRTNLLCNHFLSKRIISQHEFIISFSIWFAHSLSKYVLIWGKYLHSFKKQLHQTSGQFSEIPQLRACQKSFSILEHSKLLEQKRRNLINSGWPQRLVAFRSLLQCTWVHCNSAHAMISPLMEDCLGISGEHLSGLGKIFQSNHVIWNWSIGISCYLENLYCSVSLDYWYIANMHIVTTQISLFLMRANVHQNSIH